MLKKTVFFALLLATLGMSLPGYGAMDKYRFHMRNGKLLRGASEYVLNGIEAPGLGAPGISLGDVASRLGRAASVGADTVCFQLEGYSEDGSALSKEAEETMALLALQTQWRGMGALVRVLPPDMADEKLAMAMVKAAGEALKNEWRLVYWIDGPNTPKLVKAFRKAAPNLTVAAAKDGDIRIVDALPESGGDASVLLMGSLPPADRIEKVHFVAPGTDEGYAAFDTFMSDPAEHLAWTPDNSVLSEAERAEGWTSLFDGKTLDGWWIRGLNKKGFEVKDGAIAWAAPGAVALYTRDRYTNFILRLEYRIAERGNSGLFLRGPRTGRSSKIGMEFQLFDDAGKTPDAHTTGAVYDVEPALVNASKPAGEWNTVEIMLDGPIMKASVNGQVVQDRNLDEHDELRHRLREGFIGLQDHGCHVAFRNIRVKKL